MFSHLGRLGYYLFVLFLIFYLSHPKNIFVVVKFTWKNIKIGICIIFYFNICKQNERFLRIGKKNTFFVVIYIWKFCWFCYHMKILVNELVCFSVGWRIRNSYGLIDHRCMIKFMLNWQVDIYFNAYTWIPHL